MKPPDDPFILVSKRTYQQKERPVIRTDQETYNTLAKLAAKSGLSISAIVGQCVRYAVDRLVWVEEE